MSLPSLNVSLPRQSRVGLTGALTAAFLLMVVAFAAVPAAAEQGPPGQETAPIVHLPPNLAGDPVLVDWATARLQRLETAPVTRTDSAELTPGSASRTAWRSVTHATTAWRTSVAPITN